MTVRVAVTVAEAVTPLGDSLTETFEELTAGRTGFGPVDRFPVRGPAPAFGALRPDNGSAAELVRRLADLLERSPDGVAADRCYFAGTPEEPAPRMPAQFRRATPPSDTRHGWDRVYTGACVASSSALLDAAAAIRAGRCRSVLVVSARSVDRATFELFRAGGAMTPEPVARPLNTARRGVLLGDGAAAFLLEAGTELGDRVPLAEVTGWGRAGDGFDAVQPDPAGRGMVTAIRRALKSGGLVPGDIGQINVHGTGTALSDAAEAAALAEVFGADDIPPAYASKASLGHALESTGLVEAALVVESLRMGVVPPVAGVRPEDSPLFGSVVVSPLERRIDHALTLNLAFGGCNTALVISRWAAGPAGGPEPQPAGAAADAAGPRTVASVGTAAEPPPVPGFIESGFPAAAHHAGDRGLEAAGRPASELARMPMVLIAPEGDAGTQRAVLDRIAAGRRIPPPLFVQSALPSVLGRLAVKWGVRGGITVLDAAVDSAAAARTAAEIAHADGARNVLVIRCSPATDGSPADAEAAVLALS